MKADLTMRPRDFSSSFLSCQKDCETILRKLFVESRPYSDQLKRLLVINTKDCLSNVDSKLYQQTIDNLTLGDLREKGYIRLEPKLMMGEHEEIKSYILITFDNFITNDTNPEFRDCTVTFDILCHPDYWDIGNYSLRPLKIAGFIDGILNKARLSGIGTFQFITCNELVLDQNLAGYTLAYRAIHWTEDKDELKSKQQLFEGKVPGIQ